MPGDHTQQRFGEYSSTWETGHDFDANGDETKTDYRRMLKLVLDAGYHGYVGVEYEGKTIPEPDGIKATKLLLEKVRDEMSTS